jgi:PAS domain S-box-containing protein
MLTQLSQPWSALFEASLDGIVVMDTECRYLYVNPAASRMVGYSLEEALQRNLFMDAAPRWRPVIEAQIAEQKSQSEIHPPKQGIGYLVRANGEEFEIEYVGAPIVIEGRLFMVVMFHDVTETRRLTRNAAALSEIASTVAVAGSLEQTLDALARHVVDATGTLHCGLFLIDEKEGCVRVYGESEHYETDAREERQAWEAAIRAGAPAPGYEAVLEKRPVIVHDMVEKLLADPRFAPVHDQLRHWPRGVTLAAFPMQFGDRVVGWLNVGYAPGRQPNPAEVAFLSTIANHAAVAAENARLLVEAREKAALEERQRLARELHDSVSQALYGIALGARTARTLLERDPASAIEPLDYVLSLADAGLAEMRALIFELRPDSLKEEGLITAITKQVESVRARHGLAVDAQLPAEPNVPLELKEAIYRIAQEALTNTVRHARARRVGLRLTDGGKELVLEVADDGIGFHADGSFPGHLGLRSMRERALNLNGSFHVESIPAQGTTIRATIPIRMLEGLGV